MHIPTGEHIREHGRLFGEQTKAMIGVEGVLGAVALYAFVRSLVEHPTRTLHGHVVREAIQPSWGWLCVALGVALVAEFSVVHRLLREREGTGKISLTPQELAEFGRHMQAKET
jgi:hypothetical protein